MEKQQIEIEKIISEYQKNPYQSYGVYSPHTGIVKFKIQIGAKVQGPSGKWQEKKGTLLYTLTRQGNEKPFYAPIEGKIVEMAKELDGQFVEANTHLLTIRHKMTKEETINKILENFLHIYRAPETARYTLTPELIQKIEKKGLQNVIINPGDELLIMSRMKREVVLRYEGKPSIIYVIYFSPNTPINQGEPLLGLCLSEDLPFISKLVQKVQLEWN